MSAALDRTPRVAAVARRPAERPASRPPSPPPGLGALSPELFTAHDPVGARTEALRELRSELILRWFTECRTLAVVAAQKRDDADVVAANLAILMAQLGEPTLLIDANLRAPRVHELFGIAPSVGLTDLLMTRDVHDQAMLTVPAVENLHVLCAGAIPTNPQELVSRAPFLYLMKTLPERYRAIVIATPPALKYSDAQMIAARAHGCLLVTSRHHTRVGDVERVKSQLATGRATLLGGVIQE